MMVGPDVGDVAVSGSALPSLGEPEHPALHPGQECPTCERKLPYPKRDSSPDSKTKAFRIPTDEYEAFLDTLVVAQKICEVYQQPYADFKTFSVAVALILQDPDPVRNLLRRP